MGYSKQYKDWTNSNVDVEFDLQEVSANLAPGTEKEVTCDGIGFVKLIKDADGLLKCQMKSNGSEPPVVVTWFDILTQFNQNSNIPPTE
jgi:hypothetical protein